jgi:hypothetical protein
MGLMVGFGALTVWRLVEASALKRIEPPTLQFCLRELDRNVNHRLDAYATDRSETQRYKIEADDIQHL